MFSGDTNKPSGKIDHTLLLFPFGMGNSGLSSLGVPGVPWHTQILADQLTLFQLGGTNYAHLITTGTPGFSDLPTSQDLLNTYPASSVPSVLVARISMKSTLANAIKRCSLSTKSLSFLIQKSS